MYLDTYTKCVSTFDPQENIPMCPKMRSRLGFLWLPYYTVLYCCEETIEASEQYTRIVTHCMLGNFFSRRHFDFFLSFLKKIGFDIKCGLSPQETICIKCQNVFSEEKKIPNKKQILWLSVCWMSHKSGNCYIIVMWYTKALKPHALFCARRH